MKTIDLATASPTLADVLELAHKDNIVLRTPDGREFVLAGMDDLDHEIALIRQNKELMALLRERWQEKPKYSAQEVRALLNQE